MHQPPGHPPFPSPFPAPAGVLLPAYHKVYWMGLNASTWPAWRWLDGSPQPNVTGRYQAWGYYMPQNILEPNNIFGGENCVAANFSQAVAAQGVWGWADARCNLSMPYVCESIGGSCGADDASMALDAVSHNMQCPLLAQVDP